MLSNINSKINFKALHIAQNNGTRERLEKLVDSETYGTIDKSLAKINEISKGEDVFLYVDKISSDEADDCGFEIKLRDDGIELKEKIDGKNIQNKDFIKNFFTELASKYTFTCNNSKGLVDRLMNKYSYENRDKIN